MSTTYVCAELVKGFCKTWVAQPPGVLDSLAITKTQAVEISGSILGFFVVLVVGSVMAKSINSM